MDKDNDVKDIKDMDRDVKDRDIIIGVLALQGAFREHIKMFKKLGVKNVIEVRNGKEISMVDGLVIPGGESTTIGHLIQSNSLADDLREFVSKCKVSTSSKSLPEKAVWGTCAGMILLSDRGEGLRKEGQFLLGGLDVLVTRNYFGSQLGSFRQDITFPFSIASVEDDEYDGEEKESSLSEKKKVKNFNAVFIRAPAITEIGKGVEVLSRICKKSDSFEAKGNGTEEVIVAVRQENILATSFHPELTDDLRWHQYFIDMIKSQTNKHHTIA